MKRLVTGLSKLTVDITDEKALVRREEVHDLRGDPTRLHSITGSLTSYGLSDTLRWMIEAAQQPSHD